MNILLTATRVEGAPASVVLDAAAGPWKERADVDSVPVSDGEGDLCEVLAQLSGGNGGNRSSRRSRARVPRIEPALGSRPVAVVGRELPGLGVALTTVLAENPSRLGPAPAPQGLPGSRGSHAGGNGSLRCGGSCHGVRRCECSRHLLCRTATSRSKWSTPLARPARRA